MPILILYASYTGYTQEAATLLWQNLCGRFPHREFILLNVREADKKEVKKYSLIIFGASTWDDGLNPETKLFLEKLQSANLSGSRFALFGLGDRQFLVFCAALPIIEAQLKKQGATVLSPVFTFDNYQTGQDISKFIEWAELFLDAAELGHNTGQNL